MNKNSAVSALVLACVAAATALLASPSEAAPPADGPRIDQVVVQDVDTIVSATGAPLDRDEHERHHPCTKHRAADGK